MIPGRRTRRVQKKQALPIEDEASMKQGSDDLRSAVIVGKNDGSC